LKNVDADMERSVLASMILSPEYIPNIVHSIAESDFYSPKHKEIYRAIVKMSDNRREINIVTLNAETGSKFPADIAMLTDVIPGRTGHTTRIG